jgi:hypothetical protein
MNHLLSSDKAFADFLARCSRHPLRVLLERPFVPPAEQRIRDFDEETDWLRDFMEAAA